MQQDLIVKNVADKNAWEDFLTSIEEKTFLQSWNWGEAKQKTGGKIWRLGVYDNGQLAGISHVLKVSARRGTFLLIQHLLEMREEVFAALLDKLRQIGKEEGAAFVRIAPLWPKTQANHKIFKNSGFKESPMHANAYQATWKLDIAPPHEELMNNMRKTTRYLIRQAQKNADITIEKSQSLSDLEIYQKLNREVAKRQKFAPFSDAHIKNEFDIFSRDDQAVWLLGRHKGEVAAGALIIFWQQIAFYHQAASLSKYAKFSIPYLLQWEAIKEAKKRGCTIYDFWGFTDPAKYPKHPWAGPTLFKMGFGGRAYEYMQTQDLPLSKKYWVIYFFEIIRKIKRGL